MFVRKSESTWDDLTRELDHWAAGAATFWWRDDDATARSPALDRLLDAAGEAPVAIAVIPSMVEESLATAFTSRPDVRVLLHGWAHANHSPPGEPESEFSYTRSTDAVLGELARGLELLQANFGDVTLPVLVPPWNRLGVGFVSRLTEVGVRGLSTLGTRLARQPAPGIEQANTHVDVADWTRRGAFIGVGAALGQIVLHLEMRRLTVADLTEPTGILTHHAMHGNDAFAFLQDLAGLIHAHRAGRWLAVNEVFGGFNRTT